MRFSTPLFVLAILLGSAALAQSPTPCTNVADCSGHAISVSGNVATGCDCVCRNQWTGAACQTCPRQYNAAADCGQCAPGLLDYPACFAPVTSSAPIPPSPARSNNHCYNITQTYWNLLLQGKSADAFKFLSENASFVWPGDQAILPMAGTWYGAAGVGNFFGMVFRYFNFKLCRVPSIVGLGMDDKYAYANWAECSTLVGGPSDYVPCPNLMNQAVYECNQEKKLEDVRIVSVHVNLDNSCVAKAICNSTQGLLQCVV